MFTLLILSSLLFTANAGEWGNTAGGCQTPDKESGICLAINACKPILDALNKVAQPVSPEIRAKLKSYQCGFAGKRPKVCCPSKAINFDNGQKEDSNVDFPDVSKHKNIGLLPKSCGHLDTVDKIVNGNKTGLLEFPWMALLSYQTKSGPAFKCGGSIVNERYILTAAHCVTNIPFKLIGVRVGEHDIKTVQDCEEDEDGEQFCAPPVQDVAIEQVIFHKQYNHQSHANDIALIRVSKMDLTKENSRPVCLPLNEARSFNTSKNVVVTGWGYTETGRPSPTLLKVELPVVSLSECKKKYDRIAKLNDGQLCAGGKSKSDSCNGDSGGPLHALQALHGEPRYVQQGVVSFGPSDCGNVPIPGVYSRVAYYMDWILDNMKA